MPSQWSESRDTRRKLYTGGISRPLSRFNDGLRCLMLMASLTLRLIFESSDGQILVFCGSILCQVGIQCLYMTYIVRFPLSSCQEQHCFILLKGKFKSSKKENAELQKSNE